MAKVKEKNKSSNGAPREGIQFLNTIYFRNDWKNNLDDLLCIIYRNEKTGEKKLKEIVNPDFSFNVLHEDKVDSYHHTAVPVENTDVVTCKYTKLYDVLADISGKTKDLINWRRTKQASKQKNLHKEDMFYGSDLDIEDYYTKKFYNKYKAVENRITKGYLDIEVDILDYPSFPDERIAPCPINIVTYQDDVTNVSYTFILRNEKNPLVAKFEKNVKAFKKKLKNEIFKDYSIDKYKFYFYDSEIELLQALFATINENKPDFCMSWNARFDMTTMINRAEKQFDTPASDFMCHPDFSRKVAYYNRDNMHDAYAERNDEFVCSSYTCYLDQLTLYASLRASGPKQESYKLGHICEVEIGDTKIGYEEDEEDVDLELLPYTNFERFVIYNIKDVLLLKRLEEKNNDLNLLMVIAEMTQTRVRKCMRKTTSLKNLAAIYHEAKGLVISTNHNTKEWKSAEEQAKEKEEQKGKKKKDDKFGGALVSDPKLNDYYGEKINGKRSKFVYRRVIDADAAALYPSIKLSTNNDMETMWGQLQFYKDFNHTNPKEAEKLKRANVRGGEFMDFLQTRNWTAIGSRFFGLPDLLKVIKLLKKKGVL